VWLKARICVKNREKLYGAGTKKIFEVRILFTVFYVQRGQVNIFLKSANRKSANVYDYSANCKSSNFYKILHTSVSKQSYKSSLGTFYVQT
jgi:hypothetical protein